MVDDDDVEPGFRRRGERRVGRRAAIDGDDHRRAFLLEPEQRRQVRAIALALAIGDVDRDPAARRLDKTLQQGGRCGAVDIVIAEDRDHLVVSYRAR